MIHDLSFWIKDSRAVLRSLIGFLLTALLRSHQSPYAGSLSFKSSRSTDSSTCLDPKSTEYDYPKPCKH